MNESNRPPSPGAPSLHPQGVPRPQAPQPHLGGHPAAHPHPPQPAVRPPAQMQPGAQQPRPAPPMPSRPVADDPISLVEEVDVLDDLLEVEPQAPSQPTQAKPATPPPAPVSKIRFSSEVVHKKHDWKRKTTANGSGAVRVKSFHAKYSEGGLDHLDELVNVWLDDHPEIEVKFATTTVHVFEGKIREPAIVVNVWY